ncbi:response regulator [Humibacillus xanthopallidus]|uniref:LuxR family two component transcriptional regulator n=1 Tax=Humibacillus xanthopallidus TaxID=412689 RepID=A0A543I1V0_9MICO|nr:response regulator transcription factor [Humibacillus xanthopallidus]TQM64564.1 LuxR family two component transcriptional regulator [Humibacillus xanthopallidus]
MTISVVLADDHTRMRARIRAALESGGCEVRGEGATAADAVRLVSEHHPDVALLDIHMPGSGIQAAREITRTAPDVAVVMLTQSAEDEDLFDSLRAGASGYLLKDADPAALADTLRGVLAGEAAMPRRLVARLMDEFRAPTRRRFGRTTAATKLTAREWEVMQLLSEGLSTEEVSRRLFLSPTTVRVHVSSVLKKLRVKDRDSAFRLLRGD